MNKLEVNISLLIMTFLTSVQYVFLAGVPENISHFAFLCVTNLAGFLIILAFFFGELFRLDTRQVFQSMLLSAELVVANLFLLLGGRGITATVTAAVIAAYFVFIAAFSAVFLKQIPSTGTIAGVIAVLFGLFLTTDADISGFMNANVFYLIAADIVFALYVIAVGKYAASSNPSILAMGQMFFCFLFSLGLWTVEAVFFGGTFSLPSNPKFWGSVIYISFFIRGLYGLVQVYAQRYTTPLNLALISSTSIIMTMLTSPVLSSFLGNKPDIITWSKVLGGIVIVLGILMTEPQFFAAVRRLFVHEGSAHK